MSIKNKIEHLIKEEAIAISREINNKNLERLELLEEFLSKIEQMIDDEEAYYQNLPSKLTTNKIEAEGAQRVVIYLKEMLEDLRKGL